MNMHNQGHQGYIGYFILSDIMILFFFMRLIVRTIHIAHISLSESINDNGGCLRSSGKELHFQSSHYPAICLKNDSSTKTLDPILDLFPFPRIIAYFAG